MQLYICVARSTVLHQHNSTIPEEHLPIICSGANVKNIPCKISTQTIVQHVSNGQSYIYTYQSVTFVKILIRMNVRIYSYQQNYTNEYPNIFILIFLTRTNVRISIRVENCNPWLSLQGYKEFTVHMSSFHGGLDMVMAMDAREEVRFDNIWIDMILSFIGCVW